jgi:hypothetical protein
MFPWNLIPLFLIFLDPRSSGLDPEACGFSLFPQRISRA